MPHLRSISFAALLLAGLAGTADLHAAGMVSVASTAIKALASTGLVTGVGLHVDTSPTPEPGFWGTMQTADGRNLLYFRDSKLGTSHFVFNIDGTPHDLEFDDLIAIPVTASGSGYGASITFAKDYGALRYGSTWTIVNNPHTNTPVDTVMIQGWITNNSAYNQTYAVGLRMLLDVEIIDASYDGAPLSVDNGVSVITTNTLYSTATGFVPSDWWTYDNVNSPSLAARGVTWGNAYGTPATHPDAVELCDWPDVAGPGYYQVHPAIGSPLRAAPYADTCVVLWFTGTGQPGALDTSNGTYTGDAYSLAPGKTLVFTTYYGLNQGNLLASPTPYASYTASPTWTVSPSITPTRTISPTFSVSPTISPTFTITRTHTISPTYSVSPTISPSFTITPTYSYSPTATPTPTVTATPSATPSYSFSPTYSSTPSFTASPTVTATPSITATFSISPTYSISPTESPSPTVTATQVPRLTIVGKPPNPNPSGPGGPMYLPYVLSRDATVRIRIFDIAGEKIYDLPAFAGLLGANEERWPLCNDAGAGVASGVFIGHYVATADGQKAECWEKMAVLR